MAVVAAVAMAVAAVSSAVGGSTMVRNHPAPAPVVLIEAVVVVEAPPVCDRWCQWVGEAYGVAAQGNMSDVIYAAAQAYGVPGMAGWGLATAVCESGLDPLAWSGWYEGLFQHDPYYWPARAEGAGFGGASAFDPVANAFTSMWMVSVGYPLSHWSCSPW